MYHNILKNMQINIFVIEIISECDWTSAKSMKIINLSIVLKHYRISINAMNHKQGVLYHNVFRI